MENYDHKKIESKWQKTWADEGIYKTPDSVAGKENFYTLVEFAYPSGNLHVGHWYAFGVPDMYARMKRMQGKNVLFPFGFDSFGLPAENAAIKNNVDPKKWTYENIDRMRAQLKTMGAMFDWDREVITSDPAYYKWTQWLFIQMFNAGMVGKKKSIVNWDPVDQTVLANEQVLSDGTAERSGAVVEKRELEEWAFKITDYADRLIGDLDGLDWPEPIKEAQRQWIGRSEGAEISFKLSTNDEVKVFTTRPDTLFGGTYIVLAPEHPLIQQFLDTIENRTEVEAYIASVKNKSELERQQSKEKSGVPLKGITATNPATNELMPIWIADFVIASYGTGAIFGDAHDERDFEFAKKYDIPLRATVRPKDDILWQQVENLEICYEGEGALVNSGFLDGQNIQEAKKKIIDWLEKTGNGTRTTQYKIRDWGISRQRYWGCPIPIVYDPQGKAHPIPDEYLPWVLPTDVDFTPDGTAPLARSEELKKRTEEIFGTGWTSEVDTMDTFVDSSWYYLRYLAANNDANFSPLDIQKNWMPVDFYSGGAEHTTMHLLYSRYFYKALFDLGLVTESEPYKKRMNRSLILAEDGRKMSKRWGNTVDPDEQVNKVGADSVRVYLAFIGPHNEVSSYPWSYDSLVGVRRFIEKVWRIAGTVADDAADGNLRVIHKTIKKVGEDLERLKTNTAVSALMECATALDRAKQVSKDELELFLKILAPLAPHMTEEIWREMLGHRTFIHLENWPEFDPALIVDELVTVGVQINGKMRGTIEIAPDATEDEAKAAALALDTVIAHLNGALPKKVIYVPGRIVNIVV